MKFSTTGQEKGDLLIQVTTWAGLIVNNNRAHYTKITLYHFNLVSFSIDS